MIDEPKLYDALAGIYEHLRLQMESLYHAQCGATALVGTLMETRPELVPTYEKHYREFDEEMRDQHASTLRSIDAVIHKLRSGEL